MKIKIVFITLVAFLLTSITVYARVDPEKLVKMKERAKLAGPRMDCQPAQAQYDLEINNVKARLLTGGDVWWDLTNGKYIVPKPAPGFPEVSAIYAGGVWIGGIDPNGALKLAGVTYRSGNNTDYYPGPLDENGQTTLDVCSDWDRFFVVKGESVLKFASKFDASVIDSTDFPCDSIPDDVKYWPARGNPFFNEKYDFALPNQNLADYWDEDGEGYNPCDGDFPIIVNRGCYPESRQEAKKMVADEMVFWIYNDNGGPHRLTQATAIQMEVQVQAFGYATNDEINDMTFYRFKLINKASDDIRDCYFAMWVDADLGCPFDDYIGCDVDRSMAYVYNEDAADGDNGTDCVDGIQTYGEDIPILGIDYFRGPRGPKVFCGVDTDGKKLLCDPEPGTGEQDTIIELGMTSFLYQNNSTNSAPIATQDPQIDFEFYNILKGQWKDGTPVTHGGSGYNPGETDTVRYVFPDPPNDETGWSMCSANLPFDDRRTVQATGPLLLQPGAKNELIIGAVFVPNIDYPCPSISKLNFADDIAQALFEDCFILPDGPDAPDMFSVELDRQLILMISNDTLPIETNNSKEEYMEKDLKADDDVEDPYYRFEGYKIYQLANPNVSIQELDNIDQARLMRQVDVKNGVTEIYNWVPLDNPDPNPDPNTVQTIWVPERKIAGEDKGIRHSFNVTIDQFANSDRRLVNHKNYYYTVIAYGYNNYLQYQPDERIGQRTPYIEGRRNVQTYTFTPRPVVYKELQTAYGQEAAVTRIEGIGTGFNALDLADGEIETIMDGSFDGIISYKAGNGPINPKVIDPLNIKDAEYRLEIIGEHNGSTSKPSIESGAKWNLLNITTGQTIASEKTIEEINEQIIYGEGFSIAVNQVGEPGDEFDEDNGAITQVYEYADMNATNWWNAIPAFQGLEVVNQESNESDYYFPFVNQDDQDDPKNVLSKMDDGYFMPFKSARWLDSDIPYITPGWQRDQGYALTPKWLKLAHLNNVDIIFTSDKSKWSKCVVVESAIPAYEEFGLATKGNRAQFYLRSDSSIDENGNEIEGEGMSYFPGYAIDVETGERLNIFFGENSVFNSNNDALLSDVTGEEVNSGSEASDMIWNPTSKIFTTDQIGGEVGGYNNYIGGQHYVYVTRQEYDGCESLAEQLTTTSFSVRARAVSFITWTAIPLPKEPLLSLEEGLIPNELTVKLRVTNPFNKEINVQDLEDPTKFVTNGGLPVYEFAFNDVEAKQIEPKQYSDALDNVQVVPNPYYAYSSYERDKFQNVVKVTNLPPRAIVTIYTLDGKFIQQFNRDAFPIKNKGINPAIKESQIAPDLEWNLKNSKGIPVSSGVYLFHVFAPELGVEKSIKWFGVNRRFDPSGL